MPITHCAHSAALALANHAFSSHARLACVAGMHCSIEYEASLFGVSAHAEGAVVVKAVVGQVSIWHHQREALASHVLCSSSAMDHNN
jgi:hypothetical protein